MLIFCTCISFNNKSNFKKIFKRRKRFPWLYCVKSCRWRVNIKGQGHFLIFTLNLWCPSKKGVFFSDQEFSILCPKVKANHFQKMSIYPIILSITSLNCLFFFNIYSFIWIEWVLVVACWMWDLVPWPGIKHWEQGVLTTEPLGKSFKQSLNSLLKNVILYQSHHYILHRLRKNKRMSDEKE